MLKKDKLAQDKKINELKASLANIKESIIRERRQADYKVVNNNKDFNSDYEKTKYENEKLNFENKKKNIIIQGLQSNKTLNKKNPKSINSKKILKARQPLYDNEKDTLISQLREQLKIAQEDRHKLVKEMHNLMVSNINSYNLNRPNGSIQNTTYNYNYNNSYNDNNNNNNNINNIKENYELDT